MLTDRAQIASPDYKRKADSVKSDDKTFKYTLHQSTKHIQYTRGQNTK